MSYAIARDRDALKLIWRTVSAGARAEFCDVAGVEGLPTGGPICEEHIRGAIGMNAITVLGLVAHPSSRSADGSCWCQHTRDGAGSCEWLRCVLADRRVQHQGGIWRQDHVWPTV